MRDFEGHFMVSKPANLVLQCLPQDGVFTHRERPRDHSRPSLSSQGVIGLLLSLCRLPRTRAMLLRSWFPAVWSRPISAATAALTSALLSSNPENRSGEPVPSLGHTLCPGREESSVLGTKVKTLGVQLDLQPPADEEYVLVGHAWKSSKLFWTDSWKRRA